MSDPILVSFSEAKAHLQVRDLDHDAEIAAKLAHASGLVRDYLKDRNDPTWTETTAPASVQAVVLLLLGNLYEHRGDDIGAKADAAGDIWAAITPYLVRLRDPALA